MRGLIIIAAAAVCAAAAAGTASAQDFKQSYDLGPGGRVVVTNMSGNVTLEGYDGSSIVVTGTKTGRDRDKVTVVDTSSSGSVEIGVHYPRNCHCDASIDFVVQVPRSTNYEFEKIASMSGDVKVSGVTGAIHVSAMSGNVRVGDVAGTVEATAMSGDIDVDIARLEGSGDLTFTAMSGNVDVRLPASAGATVEMRTTSGDITTDFPIEVHEQKYGPGRWAEGRVGDGSRRLRVKSMSGDVKLTQH
jgi:hypothetical protein